MDPSVQFVLAKNGPISGDGELRTQIHKLKWRTENQVQLTEQFF